LLFNRHGNLWVAKMDSKLMILIPTQC
jgi:hypothetical protein